MRALRRVPVFGLAFVLVLATLARAEARPDHDPHVHGAAVVRSTKLVGLARECGGLQAGLKALGLDKLPLRRAIGRALRQMDLHQPDHGAAYDRISDFRRGAFAGARYPIWVRAVLEEAHRNAAGTYMQLSARELASFVPTVRAERLELGGVELLVSMPRRDPNTRTLAATLEQFPEVQGIDILGAETEEQDPAALDRAVDLLVRAGRSSPILRIHAGEGYLGDHGASNVNIALRTLVARSERTDLSRFRIVLAHVARVKDLAAAQRDIATLRARGVEIVVNVNPLSNLVYHAVEDLREIDALRLGVAVVAGSDNVGSLWLNARIVDLLVQRRFDQAARIAKRFQDRFAPSPR